MNIVLIGCRCSGKTSVGKLLALQLEREFVDTDGMIEKEAGRPIGQLIRTRGWPRFREMEMRIIDRVSAKRDQIIATGGGAVMDEANVMKLKSTGRLVWLRADPETLRGRMMQDMKAGRTRPPLTQGDPMTEIEEILSTRWSRYETASDLVVDTDSLDLREAARCIVCRLSLDEPTR